MKRLVLILFLSQRLLTCYGQDMLPFNWLSGTWEMLYPNGSFRLEIWNKKDLSTMYGQGLKVMQDDTTILETIQLYIENQATWYAPVVPDQNNGLPVRFKLVSFIDNEFVFENPEHDFPQRIIYKFKPILSKQSLISSPGDTLSVAVTSLLGEGLHFNFSRK